MCGIVGLIGYEQDNRAALHAMCEAIVHRGPDDEGIDSAGNAGIAMRRLSIIDVDGGHQPIYNEDKTLALVFNGEIYNYLELHDELVTYGHQFQTKSDSETILHAYEQWGTDCLSRFNGMFAFAIWNRRDDTFLVARDRLGKKPVYYRHDGTRFAFASEIRALREIPGLSWTVSLEAVHHYLSLQYIPSPLSIFTEVQKLPPAHYLITNGRDVQIKRYWNVGYEPKWSAPLDDLRDELRQLVGDAVRLRLRSDVPLGAFLSGGLDSAVILAEMARQLDRPVEAFTISFEEEAFDEAEYAAQVAQLHGAHHHRFTVRLSAQDDPFLLARWLDEPFANSSALATYYLAQQTRQHVTVALSGDGSDEVFAGYQRYILDRLVRPYEYVPPFIRNAISGVVARFGVRQDVPTEANWFLGIKRLQQVASIPRSASILRWGSYFSEPAKQALYTPLMRKATQHLDSTAVIADDFNSAHAARWLDRTLYADLVNYLPDDGHVKVDRMSMANSLEVRNPYMDYRLVEFAAKLPLHAKIQGLTQKRLLREAYTDVLPPATVKRPKRGFAVPVSQWLHQGLEMTMQDMLLDPCAATSALFQADTIRHLLQEHASGKDDHSKRLWALLMLELWLRQHDIHVNVG